MNLSDKHYLLLLLLCPLVAFGFKPVEGFCEVEKPALGGLDVVAYFLKGEPEEGSVFYHVYHEDRVWWFSCRDHRERFRKNPRRYLPYFEGVPLAAYRRQKLPEVDPNAFVIEQGRLQLFESEDRLQMWEIRRDLNALPVAASPISVADTSDHPAAEEHAH